MRRARLPLRRCGSLRRAMQEKDLSYGPRVITILDGPTGTELAARGVPTPAPAWSAHAVDHAPDVLAAIHRSFAAAGATVHTAATFRTKRRQVGARWEHLARRAVAIARAAVPAG